jgi:hypothetical protein
MPGVATEQATQGEPEAGTYTVDLNRCDGITGATGVKTAVIAEKRAQENLIGPHHCDQQLSHRRR